MAARLYGSWRKSTISTSSLFAMLISSMMMTSAASSTVRPEKVYEAARALQASVRSPGALALGSRCQRLPLQPETVPGGPQRVRRLWPEGP